MLYHLFKWFEQKEIHFPGSSLMDFITVRVMLAVLLSLLITLVYGKKLIRFLQKKQVGESVRDLGLAGEEKKKGTPTMGGIIIITRIIITLVFAPNGYTAIEVEYGTNRNSQAYLPQYFEPTCKPIFITFFIRNSLLLGNSFCS